MPPALASLVKGKHMCLFYSLCEMCGGFQRGVLRTINDDTRGVLKVCADCEHEAITMGAAHVAT